MKTKSITLAGLLLLYATTLRAQQTVSVPGISQLYLAGQPAGTTYGSDSVPLNAPAAVNIPLIAGRALFLSANGLVMIPNGQSVPPSGASQMTEKHGVNGIGGLIAPNAALVGVFLGDRLNADASPPDLDFSAGALDATVISPLLQQPFYIGSGRKPNGGVRLIVVPDGATALYLAVHGNGSASQNSGAFQVTVRSPGPPPQPPGNPLAVPGISQLYLAGQSAGASYGPDSVPLNSPPQVKAPFLPGQVVRIVARGQVRLRDGRVVSPSGSPTDNFTMSGALWAGLGGIAAPEGSLIGVFLGDRLDTSARPPVLDFTGGAADAQTLGPLLQQPFYVGDGTTPSGQLRRFVAPAGATRLMLAVHTYGTILNSGYFLATMSPELPETPAIAAQGIRNGAGFGSPPLAPGSIATIFGTKLGGDGAATATPLPDLISETAVWLDLQRAPLFFTSSGQINMQIPFGIRANTVQVVVSQHGVASLPVTLPIADASPGLFVLPDGSPIAVNYRTGNLVSDAEPAQPGDVLTLYTTGLSAPASAPPSGDPTPGNKLYLTSSPASVRLGGMQITPMFAGLAPGLVGVYQINFTVPTSIAGGSQALQVVAAGAASNTASLSVQR